MTPQDQQRIKFCAKVFKAFGLQLTLLVDHKVTYQVGEHLQYRSIDALERKAEYMLANREELRIKRRNDIIR